MWDENAHKKFPQISLCDAKPKTWCAKSRYAHYTNNPTMYRTHFFKTLIGLVPLDVTDIEPWLTMYWTKQNFTVAYSDGIFTHARLDRTFGVNKTDESYLSLII